MCVRVLGACGLAAAMLGLAGPAFAGSDFGPTWSPDGSFIVFFSGRDTPSLQAVNPDGTGERTLSWLPASYWFSFSPDWSRFAYVVRGEDWQSRLVVERSDGSDPRTFDEPLFDGRVSWAPDGTHLAVVLPATRNVGDVAVASIEGGAMHRIARGVFPSWSPAGDWIAYIAGETHSVLHVVRPDGSDDRTLLEGAYGPPAWSPDGTRLAVGAHVPSTPRVVLEVLRADGTPVASFDAYSFDYAWSPSGDAIAYSTGDRVYRIDLSSGREVQVADVGDHPGGRLAWSPDGRQLAFASSGECRDRDGIYVLRLDGSEPVRITNDCRIVGTPENDVLTGTPLGDVVLGLGGDDVLTAAGVGDTLEGGPGDDVLLGGPDEDVLDGGPGDDVVEAGPPPADPLASSYATDTIRGGEGRDLIEAQDGVREVVSCGTNADPSEGREADIAYVDDEDEVSPDCEHVYLPGSGRHVPPGITTLRIRIWPRGRGPNRPRRRYVLRCRPAGGTLPHPGKACAQLARFEDPFAPASIGIPCVLDSGGLEYATVQGRYGNAFVQTSFNRLNPCEIERWDRVALLFPILVR